MILSLFDFPIKAAHYTIIVAYNAHYTFVNYVCNIFLDVALYLIQLTINTAEFLVNAIFQTWQRRVKSFLKSARFCFIPLCLVLCDSLGAIFKYFKGLTKNQTNITIAIINFNKNSNIQLMDTTITYINSNTIISQLVTNWIIKYDSQCHCTK